MENNECPDLMIKKMHMEDGKIDIELESNHVLQTIASHVGKMLKEHNAPNFVTMRMEDTDGTAFEVTVRKVSGETPAEQLHRLTNEFNEYRRTHP